MKFHLIIGAGPIGRALAAELVARGQQVRVASRSGTEVSGTEAPGTEVLRLDAADRAALTEAARGAATIYVCTNPPYHQWAALWPPIADSVIAAAEASGAGVVMMGNLYAYGQPDGAMTPESPERPTETKGRVRGQLWKTLKATHNAGRIRATEVRASDYFGSGAGAGAHLGSRVFEPVMAGKPASMIGNPNVPHAWAYLGDIAHTLAEVGTRDDLWGRIVFAPHAAQESARSMAERISEASGAPTPRLRQMPPALLTVLAWFMPMMREIKAVSYQHTEPYLVDDTSSRQALGLEPTPVETAIAETVAWTRGEATVSAR